MNTDDLKRKAVAGLSPLNFNNTVRSGFQISPNVMFHDVTLRDGEQSPGVVFKTEDRVRIAQALNSLGVHRIEAGFPVISDEDREGVTAVAEAGLDAEVWGFGRCLSRDVEINAECLVKNMILEIAISELKMQAYGIDREQVIARMLAAMERAKELGLTIAFMPVDLTRADMEFAQKIITLAVEKGGADEIVVVDTIGVTSPEAIYYLTQKVQKWVDVPLAIHCHNDFGLALANSIAGLKGGAHCVHVSVNCLGERAGNVDLAETVLALQLLYGLDLGIHTDRLYEISRLVEKISGYSVAFNKPVTGEKVFARESGGVVQQLLTNPASVEPYDPALVGQNRSIELGKKSGRFSIHHALDRLNLQANEEEITSALQEIKEISRKKQGSVSDDEFISILKDIRD